MAWTWELQAKANRIQKLVSALVMHLFTKGGLHPGLDIRSTPEDALLEVVPDCLSEQQQFSILE